MFEELFTEGYNNEYVIKIDITDLEKMEKAIKQIPDDVEYDEFEYYSVLISKDRNKLIKLNKQLKKAGIYAYVKGNGDL